MPHRPSPLRSATLSVIALWLVLSLACQVSPESRDAASGFVAAGSLDDPPSRGRIVEAGGSIAGFRPKSSSVSADPAVVDVARVLEDMGDVAILWYQHVQTLANPFFEGRRPGSTGAQLTRDYLEYYFRLYGLEPAFPAGEEAEAAQSAFVSYQQPFTFNRRDRSFEVKAADLAVNGTPLEEGEAFTILGNSASGVVTAPVSFVGYAIESGPDDYTSFDEDTDLSGRIALMLRYAPLDGAGEPIWESRGYGRQAGLARKMRAVAERGAAAIIMVNPPGAAQATEPLENPQSSRRFGRPLEIPAMQMTTEAADELIREADPLGRDLAAWRDLADRGSVTVEHLSDDVRVAIIADVNAETIENDHAAANVGAILPGRGELADEWVVIGAHHDHVGDGSLGGVMPGARGQMHPGADDNASGTAGVLVLAKMLSEAYASAPEHAPLRSVLFATFDAEEMGLHGSRHLVGHLPCEAEQISLCLNMDMIGRLRNDELWVLGTETGEGLSEMLRPHFLQSGLTVAVNGAGSGRSDDANFHRVEVPALHFFTGMHTEYTSPRDLAHTVNPAGAARVVGLIYEIAYDAARRQHKLAYREPESGPGRGQDRGYAPVRLGIRPGMGDQDVPGILIDGVSEGTSAAEAGMHAGDIITAWDDHKLETLGDLFELLQEHKPGDKVKLSVMREGKTVVLDVTLKSGE